MRYIETIVLLNVLIHISFVRLSNFIMNKRNNYLLILLSVVIDSIYVCLYLLFPESINSYKYLFVLFISIIPFLGNKGNKTLCLSLIYLMLNFILGGTSGIMIKIINHYVAVIVCLILINVFFIVYIFIKNKRCDNKKLIYEIIIKYKETKLVLEGFYDTGNFLITDGNIPVVFVNEKYKMGKYYGDLCIQTVNNLTYISLYKIDDFQIKINNKYFKKDVYIAYSNINYDVMFGSVIF